MNRFKLKALAAAVGIAVAGMGGNAVAAIANAASGNSELFLTVWDTAAQRSYTRDLGVFLDSYGTQNAANAFTTNVDVTPTFSQSFAADTTWATFAGASTPAQVASWRWSVVGSDSAGLPGPNGLRMVYTSSFADQTRAALAGNLATNGNITQIVGKPDTYIAGLNQSDTTVSINNSYIVTDPSSAGYIGQLDVSFGTFVPNLNVWEQVGTGMNFNYVTRGSASSSATEALFRTYGTAAGGPSQWLLGTDGNLTFAASVAPIPEPGEWAMLLAGLAVVGSIARRRLSSHV